MASQPDRKPEDARIAADLPTQDGEPEGLAIDRGTVDSGDPIHDPRDTGEPRAPLNLGATLDSGDETSEEHAAEELDILLGASRFKTSQPDTRDDPQSLLNPDLQTADGEYEEDGGDEPTGLNLGSHTIDDEPPDDGPAPLPGRPRLPSSGRSVSLNLSHATMDDDPQAASVGETRPGSRLGALGETQDGDLEDSATRQALVDLRAATQDDGDPGPQLPSALNLDATMDDGEPYPPQPPPAPTERTRTAGWSDTGHGSRGGDGGSAGAARLGEAGTSFAGYTLLERIAEGGMGVVFRARQEALNRIVAVKIMKGGALASAYRRKRFVQEAEAAAALKHPHIVPIHEISEAAGHPYYVMDYVDGQPIHTTCEETKMAPDAIAKLMAQVADAVHHFHTRGIIHRDLKPDNILVETSKVEPKVIDFGIAKNLMQSDDKNITREGAVLGTPHYMSPEQAKGSHNEVDTRSDVYALGAILYELLTGRLPFEDVDPKVLLFTILDKDPDPPDKVHAGVPWELSAISMKAMEKDRERRYQTALEFKDDLERFLTSRPIKAQSRGWVYRAGKFIKRRKLLVAGASVALVLVIGLSSVVIKQRIDNQAQQLQNAKDQAASASKAEQEAKRAQEEAEKARLAQAGQLEAARRAQEEAEKARLAQAGQLEAARRAEENARKLTEALKQQQRLEEQAREAEARQREKALAERLERARAILAEPRDDALAAVSRLQEALTLVGEADEALRLEVESARMGLVVGLAEEAVSARQTALAEYWMAQGRRLERAVAAGVGAEAMARIAADIAALERGLDLIADARAAAQREDFLTARQLLAQAREQGATEADIGPLSELVEAGCLRAADALIASGRQALDRGEPAAALGQARQARRLEPEDEAARALERSAAERIALAARKQAQALSLVLESRERALRVLDEAAQQVAGTAQEALLRRERSDRARLLEDPALRGFAYVPAAPALKTPAFYIAAREVTNAEYRVFVDARGYEDAALWPEGGMSAEDRAAAQAAWLARPMPEESLELPARGLAFAEAQAYARWRSREAGATLRLPTAAEWEAAAGWDIAAQALRAYPWGEAFEAGALAIEAAAPRAVGLNPKDVSPYGVFDMGGNVAEWVTRAAGGELQPVVKGTDFFASALHARSYARVRATATPRPDPAPAVAARIGLRLLREP